MPSAAQRIPRFHHRAVLPQIFLQVLVLVKGVVFVLHNSRDDFGDAIDSLEGFRRIVVGDADGTNLSCEGVKFLV